MKLFHTLQLCRAGVDFITINRKAESVKRKPAEKSPILTLDEAASALDNESGRLIRESPEEISRGRTVVPAREGIEETGTHREFMEKVWS